MRGDSAATGPPIDQAKAGQCLGVGSVTARLKAVQPVLNIAGSPSNLARADVAGTRKAAVAGAAIESGSGFEAGDVEHVHDSQKLVSIRRHKVSFPFMRMQDVAPGGVGSYSVPHSREFMHGQLAQIIVEGGINARMDFLQSAIANAFFPKDFLLPLERQSVEFGAS